MEQIPTVSEPHAWLVDAAHGDDLLLWMLVEQDTLFAEGADARRLTGEVPLLIRNNEHGVAQHIRERQMHLGIDPYTFGASLDQVPEALDN